MKLRALLLVFILVSAGFALPAHATAPTPPYHYERLFYYREGPLAKASFFAHASSIDIFAPQSYKINDDGTLSGTVSQDLLDFAKANQVKVMPLVTNGGFSRAASKAFLGDAKKEQTAINAMLAEARDRGYAGWQFDFEQMDATDKNAYSAFILKAATAFRTQGLVTSVAVISKISDNPKDYKDGLWDNLIGVYDYTALGAAADFISIMSYDAPDSKGPIAPFPWYQSVFTYALAHIPNNKISLGIPTYYWKWNDATQKLTGIGGIEGIENVFATRKVTVTYDTVAESPALHYVDSTGVLSTLWYENARSVAAKVALVTQNHLHGVSFWMLGLELPSIYSSIKE